MLVWFKKEGNMVTASLVRISRKDEAATEVTANGIRWFRVKLADRSIQALIETLEAVWPEWKDGDIVAYHQRMEEAA